MSATRAGLCLREATALVPESEKTKILALAQHHPGPGQHHGLIAGKTSSGSSRRNVTRVQIGLTGEEGQREVCPG